MIHHYTLPLNRAVLLALTDAEMSNYATAHTSCVLQVMIHTKDRKATVEDLTIYFLYQHQISSAVEAILLGDVISPGTDPVIIRGKEFTLSGTKRDWQYGQKIDWRWGDEGMTPHQSKWRFLFEVNREGGRNSRASGGEHNPAKVNPSASSGD
ncbi:hypothetical protein ONZ45_g17505 [Pleurotus djamor]|nr:hypothetical protein ONZ45_g17505 [Pleurotus djamor]